MGTVNGSSDNPDSKELLKYAAKKQVRVVQVCVCVCVCVRVCEHLLADG